jgi:zinc protease
MKKIVFFLGFILLYFTAVFAQQMQPLPIDQKVRYGKLDNGVTYYIRHNELPKQRVDFYIAQNVGSILEEDEQNGLAHFLEHMAFNGSKSFSGNTLINYLESIGVKFGQNLNAYTSYDRTVYNISDVPAIREGIIDSCLLILHDWSGFLLLDEKEIDKERGVIREEMRSYGGANRRIMQKILPEILPDNQYSKRNIIGTEDIILNFKPETLRAFYKKWYRSDLQGLIIVGDIDPEQIEKKLKTLYADHPAQPNPAERVYYKVAGNDTPLVGIATDKEATYTAVSIDFKHDALPREMKETVVGLMTDYLNSVVSQIMHERFSDLTQQANPPFLGASLRNGLFANTVTLESLSGDVYIKGDEIETGFKTLVREIERVNKFGFTAAEYDRAKTNILTQYENAFKEKDKMQNGSYAEEYVGHFTMGGYIPGIETEYNLISSIAPNVPLEVVNQYIQELIGDKDIVITLIAPEKEGVTPPSKNDLLTWFNDAKKEDIQALKEESNNEPLLSEIPTGGKIIETSQDKVFGTTNYTLSNGVKVVIKSTNFKDDEILLSATSPGGSSHFPESESVNIKLYGSVSTLGGLGKFSQTDLRKVLAGKSVSISTGISLLYESFSGSSNVKDFETLLQLVYLNFTAPRTDEDAFQSFITRIKSQLESQEANPEIALMDTFINTLYINPIRNSRLKANDLSKVNYQTIMNWRKDRYADASDFTFIFTGNIDPETHKDLITKYLGSLPSIKRKESFLPVNENYRSGTIKKSFQQKMENPKSTVSDFYWTTFKPTLRNRIEIDILRQVLQIVYLEKVREDEGGTYSVGVQSAISNYPEGQTPLQISFETQPGKESDLNKIVYSEFQKVVAEGPRKADFDKAKEFLMKQQQEQEQKNPYWNGVITNFYRYGHDLYTDYLKILNEITPVDIQKKAKAFIDSKNLIEIIMIGSKE